MYLEATHDKFERMIPLFAYENSRKNKMKDLDSEVLMCEASRKLNRVHLFVYFRLGF